MFPLLLIVIGILVLAIGKRLAVLGAAVGALLGVGLLSRSRRRAAFGPALACRWARACRVLCRRLRERMINIVVLVMGALGGAAIVMGFLDLFVLTPA